MLIPIFVLLVVYVFVRMSRGITRSSTCLVGKTAIITGANSGLGYQTALNLASRGCKIIMADRADMEQSKRNIIKYTGNTNIETKKLDLSSLQSVRDFVSEILKSEDRLDILINNAGVIRCKHSTTKDGLHPVMQINYFGHFLLTHLLIDILKKSAPSRIIFTSSALAFWNNLTLENFNSAQSSTSFFPKFRIYCNSKVALLMASDIFAKKLEGSGVTSNAVHPGYVRTPIYTALHSSNFLMSLYLKLLQLLFAKDVWEGSQPLLHAAVSKKVGKISGKFFCDCISFVKPPVAYKTEFCERIWEASVAYVGLKPEEML